jgi:hypothetical protein
MTKAERCLRALLAGKQVKLGAYTIVWAGDTGLCILGERQSRNQRSEVLLGPGGLDSLTWFVTEAEKRTEDEVARIEAGLAVYGGLR